jgi:hypothetical protein
MSVDPTSEEDDIEEPIDGEEDEVDEELPSSDDVSYVASSSKAAVEAIEDFSIASRQKIRDELESQMAAFLARGGKINEVKPNVTADPPKKPAPDYGGRPI